mmetsp:Transcript_13050/g.26067  ORF Transcript_13050/g.26067 Transcript_13050/m.26067 type:complete len:213 (+) Transcript_13050:449-1087(+)
MSVTTSISTYSATSFALFMALTFLPVHLIKNPLHPFQQLRCPGPLNRIGSVGSLDHSSQLPLGALCVSPVGVIYLWRASPPDHILDNLGALDVVPVSASRQYSIQDVACGVNVKLLVEVYASVLLRTPGYARGARDLEGAGVVPDRIVFHEAASVEVVQEGPRSPFFFFFARPGLACPGRLVAGVAVILFEHQELPRLHVCVNHRPLGVEPV